MRFLKADKVFDGKAYLAEDRVLVFDDRNLLKEVVPESSLDKNAIEKLQGIITPGFVNAHCHLELSHLKDRIPRHIGLPAFAAQVITQRNNFPKEQVSEHMHQANLDMWNNGIVAVGDISNTEESFHEKSRSKLYYHTFIELIGLNPANALTIFEKGIKLFSQLKKLNLPGSLAPHAPYSTSRELIKLMGDHNQNINQPLSIHNQESEEEAKFFDGRQSAFLDLYNSLGLDLSWYKAPGTSSLEYYREALPKKSSVLVHNTFTTAAEVEASKDKTIFWCFCPGANEYIEQRLPDFSVFSGCKDKICIGTDSLASNSSLDLIGEANLILESTKIFSREDILRAMTANGAEALGISDRQGRLIPGKNTGLNLIGSDDSKLRFIKKIN